MRNVQTSNEKVQKGTWSKLLKYCKKYSVMIVFAILFAMAGSICTLAGPDKLSQITDEVTEGITPDTDTLKEISTLMQDNVQTNMTELMKEIQINLQTTKSDLTFNGQVISLSDQMKTLELVSKKDMDHLPSSVQYALYSDIEIKGTTISTKDQFKMVELLSKDQTLESLDKLPKSVYNLVKPKMNLEKIMYVVKILVCIYLASVILSILQGWIMSTVTQKVTKQLRTDISKKINKLPMSYYHHHSTGDVLSRVTNDVDTISMSLNQSIGTLVSAVTLFVGSLFMMIKTNGIMTIAGVLSTILGFGLMMLIMGRSQKYFTRQQRHLGALNGHIEEMYSGHTVVKAYNGEKLASSVFKSLNDKLRDSGFKAQALSGLMMPIMMFIGNFGYVVVCVVGAALAMNDQISFGVIVSFMMYIRFFTQPLSQMAQAAQSLQSAGAASGRVFEFLEAEEMEDESEKHITLVNPKGEVIFSHVKFGYEPNQTIIKDFSAVAKPGQKIAIVGPTGAGKSTLVNLLMRFYEIESGQICIDGIDTATMKREMVHSQFCMVLQDTWLFEGSVRENLIYDSENKDEETMIQACKAVGLDHFISTLPQGYDTILNDEVSLSQGQKQQLTIARAMIANKPILILDEATSSIDTRTEALIEKGMDSLMKGRTVFVIAHRLSTVRNADVIIVLDHGRIIERGNHEELIEQKGMYYQLYHGMFELD